MSRGEMPRRWLTSILVALGGAVAIVVSAVPASAHDNTGDAIALTVTEERVLGTAPVPFAELGYQDTSGDGLIDPDEMAAQAPTVSVALVDTLREHVRVEVDGQEAVIIGAGPAPVGDGGASASAASEYVEVMFATGPHDGAVSQVTLKWSFTSPSDRVLLSGADESVAAQLSEDGTASILLGAGATVRSFLVTGIDHVLFGLDHLLFLVVLTFAVVGSTVTRASAWRVVKLVTAFTIGHATSLCLAYFDLLSVPAQWVEPAIALSIVAAAVLAVRGKGDTIRPWIATLVGLVHGLGFASSLAALGLATADHISALAAFNLGIDLAQTAVVLLVTGAIWVVGKVLAERRSWARVVVCSGAGLVGLTWTVTRVSRLTARHLRPRGH